jgi:hypothetical protein
MDNWIQGRSRGPNARALRAGFLLALACWLAATAVHAASDWVTIATGAPDRAYHGIGERLRDVGRANGLRARVVATDGSVDNLRRLADPADPTNVALVQSDALHAFIAERPGFGAQVKVLESVGPECVFAVTAADGDIANLKDWARADAPAVALPAPDSGVAVTHAVMAELIPELADDRPVYLDPASAIAALHGGADGARVDVVFTVHRAKFRGPELSAVLERPDRYRVIPIEDRRLRLELPDGSEVYKLVELPLVRDSAIGSLSVDTLCTKGLLVAVPGKIAADQAAKLEHLIDYDWMRVYPEPR